MKEFHRYPNYNGGCAHGAPTVPFLCFRPDLSQEEILYNVDGVPVNIIDNAESNPILQNVASQVLQPVEDSSFDYTGLNEKEVVRNMPRRHMDTSELALMANNNLRQMDKDYKESQTKNE